MPGDANEDAIVTEMYTADCVVGPHSNATAM